MINTKIFDEKEYELTLTIDRGIKLVSIMHGTVYISCITARDDVTWESAVSDAIVEAFDNTDMPGNYDNADDIKNFLDMYVSHYGIQTILSYLSGEWTAILYDTYGNEAKGEKIAASLKEAIAATVEANQEWLDARKRT